MLRVTLRERWDVMALEEETELSSFPERRGDRCKCNSLLVVVLVVVRRANLELQ